MEKDKMKNLKMKMIGHGFAPYYFLTETGEVYSARSNKFIKPRGHSYKLQTDDQCFECISTKGLYRLVYDKPFCNDNIENLEGEEWKEIPQTGGIYLCSNLGRIKSLFGYNAIILRGVRNSKGYERVDITRNGRSIRQFVHHLVAECWLDKPENENIEELVVHHIDNNHYNNKACNLKYMTIEEHIQIHNQ
ncbi:MAG: hypothetical protein J6A04_03975 [Clostridia bacterium]|nr:hypothetical protein [Clostridia bacterium]MBP3581146.1 hypothetical protein [Clostridia bacterium]MBP3681428.1 hypothetical protein [Clostridia bacterium]